MTEEQVIEVEVVESTEPQPSSAQAIVDEAVKFVEVLGTALANTAQDVSNLMVVKVDKDTRRYMDMLVATGAVKNRTQAANALLEEGVEAKRDLFEKIERTHEQIQALKSQMRSLVAG